jgi:Protein of unknown function (DUF3016)
MSQSRWMKLAAAAATTAALLGGPAHAAATVEVRYVEPDNFADIGRSSWDRERTMKALTAHLQKLGLALPEGQTLRLDVTDVDLAGDIRPWGTHELRVLRGQADWPQISLRYTLLEGERTLKSGEVRLSDLAYMQTLSGRDRPGEELAVEKRMMRRWFAETFSAP